MRTKYIGVLGVAMLFCILASNFTAMLLLNILTLKPIWILPIYWISLTLYALMMRRYPLLQPAQTHGLSGKELKTIIIITWIFCTALVLVRFSYLYEGISQSTAVIPRIWDENAHIMELNSLIQTERFPAQYALFDGQYLGFYYCTWMLGVLIYYTLPFSFMTVKLAYFVMNAIYIVLFGFALLYMILAFAKNKKQVYTLYYLIFIFGGFSIASILMRMLSTQRLVDVIVTGEVWMRAFNYPIELWQTVSSILWVPHHFSALISILLSYQLYKASETFTQRERVVSYTAVVLLLANAIMSSPFICLGVLPFGLYFAWNEVRRKAFRALMMVSVALILSFPLLWLYFLKDSVGLWFYWPPQYVFVASSTQTTGMLLNVFSSMVFYFFLVILELLIPLILIVKGWREHLYTQQDKVLITLSLMMLLLCLVVGFSGANNFAMRSTAFSLIILFYIASKAAIDLRLRPRGKVVAVFLCLIFALSTVQEIAHFAKNNMQSVIIQSDQLHQNRDVVDNMGAYDFERTQMLHPITKKIHAINTDRSVKEIDLDEYFTEPELRYMQEDWLMYSLIEKRFQVDQYLDMDLVGDRVFFFEELYSDGPQGIWKWQDWMGR